MKALLGPAPAPTRGSGVARRTRRRRNLGPAFLLATLGFGVLVVSSTTELASARRALTVARSHLNVSRKALTVRRSDEAAIALRQARTSIEAAGRAGRAFPLGLLRSLPVIGSPPKAVAAGVRSGREAIGAGQILVEAHSSFPTSPVGTGANTANLASIHAAVLRSDQALAEAAGHLHRAVVALDGPAGATLPPVSHPARALRQELERAHEQLDGARRGMALLADLFGPTTDTRLLVLAQDSLELRPTGGYIGSYGVLHFDRGVARLEVFGATEDLPAPSPPLPAPADLAPWLPDAWGLSNANWWPDFPTTAAAAREMYRRQGGPEVDGVLALTENAIATLIGALGPLHVPGYDRPVTEDGFEDRVVYEVELKRPPDQPRKRFLVELAKVLFDRLVQVPSDQLSGAAQAIGRSVGSGDVQLWFADEGRQSRIKGTVVAGELPAPAGDFLLVVDANLTASKANLGLRKQIDYRVRRAGRNRVVGRLDVEVRNEGPATDVNRYYNGYLRVYVPRGSRLLSGNAQQRLKAAEDGPFDVLTDRVVVSPGERRTVRFEYELPRSVHAGSDYRLVWLRQPGTPRDTLRASVGTRATVADPGERRMQLAQRIEGRGIAESIRSIFHGLR